VDVVVDAVVSDDDSGFEERIELPDVEQIVSEAPVERFDPGVLPRRTRIDEHRVDTAVVAPVSDGVAHELGPVVKPQKRWRSASLDGATSEGADHDRQTLAGELVNEVQQLHLTAIGSAQATSRPLVGCHVDDLSPEIGQGYIEFGIRGEDAPQIVSRSVHLLDD